MILFINTTDFNTIEFAVVSEKTKRQTFTSDPHKSHEVLAFLQKFLKKIHTKKITKIIVNKGPGSYTGTRVGVTHALALGFAWGVPVVSLDASRFTQQLQKTGHR